jgi:hypothetical protein
MHVIHERRHHDPLARHRGFRFRSKAVPRAPLEDLEGFRGGGVHMRRHGVLAAEGPVDVLEDELPAGRLARERDDPRPLADVGILEPEFLNS